MFKYYLGKLEVPIQSQAFLCKNMYSTQYKSWQNQVHKFLEIEIKLNTHQLFAWFNTYNVITKNIRYYTIYLISHLKINVDGKMIDIVVKTLLPLDELIDIKKDNNHLDLM